MAGLYDFSASGPGTFTFDPVSTFQVIGLDDNFETASDARPVSITITDVSKRGLNLEKRHQVSCRDDNKRTFISDSAGEAVAMATRAISYMHIHGSGDQLYKDYFGRNVILDVMVNFNKIVNEEAFPGIMSCSDPSHSCTGNSVTYTQQSGDHMDIFFCDPFYGLVSSGSLCTGTSAESRSHRGGQTLRALAYALLPNTGKQVDGCSESRGLTDDKKINNLDTYMVSTQILRCLPRARALTRGRDLCSVSPPRSTSGAVVNDENIEKRGVSKSACAFDSCIIPRLERNFKSFVRRIRICQVMGLDK